MRTDTASAENLRAKNLRTPILRTKIVLALTVLVYLTTGRAPGVREPRNPDTEQAGARAAVMMKRAWT